MNTCIDCGSVLVPMTDGPTGIAYTAANEPMCYPCADKRQIAQLTERAPMLVYMSSDERTLTTWTGGKLATITRVRKARNNFGGTLRYYFRATDVHGAAWHGTSPGPNMFARMRPSK